MKPVRLMSSYKMTIAAASVTTIRNPRNVYENVNNRAKFDDRFIFYLKNFLLLVNYKKWWPLPQWNKKY